MEHPDKSLEAKLFISVYAKRLQARKNVSLLSAIAQAFKTWQKSAEREDLMQQYKSRGFGLEEAARARRQSDGKSPTLKANIFEMSAAKQRRQR